MEVLSNTQSTGNKFTFNLYYMDSKVGAGEFPFFRFYIDISKVRNSDIQKFLDEFEDSLKNSKTDKKQRKNLKFKFNTEDLEIRVENKEIVIESGGNSTGSTLFFDLDASFLNSFKNFSTFCLKYLEKTQKNKTPAVRQESPPKKNSVERVFLRQKNLHIPKSPQRQESPPRQNSVERVLLRQKNLQIPKSPQRQKSPPVRHYDLLF